AAGPDSAALAVLAADEVAVDVAHLDAKATLAEEVAGGIGSHEVGQLQDPLVDRGEGEIRLVAARESANADRDVDRLARPGLRRNVHGDLERACGGDDSEPRHPAG